VRYDRESRFDDLEIRFNRRFPRGRIAANPIGELRVDFNETTKGNTVSFSLRASDGISQLVLKRNFSRDPGSASVLQTWDASGVSEGQKLSFDDNDPALRSNATSFYWIDCIPFEDSSGNVLVGPQQVLNNADLLAPDAIADFDASHEAVSGGTVQVGISFKPPTNARFGLCRIYISGYNGIADYVLYANSATSPFRFPLSQTGETVTLKAVALSQQGVESTATAPTKSLTLGSSATVPAKVMGASAAELSTGVQVSFPAGPETNITSYAIYRGPKGSGFGAASSIGTVSPTGAAAYSFLDSVGLGGAFDFFVVAVNAIGNASASAAINTVQLNTTADLPPNAPSNYTNTCTVDSIDAGTDATIRIYGAAGGVGTSWTQKAGFGDVTYPYGTISGKTYSLVYWVVYDTAGAQYLAFTSLPSVMADKYVQCGKITAVASGGGTGPSGGGGTAGGSGGGCPDVETWLTPELQAANATVGDLLECLIDGQIVKKPILSIEFMEADCFLIIAGRAAKVVSWNTRFDLPDGSWLRANQMEGQPVFTDDGWITAKIFYAGKRKVAKINLGGQTFAGSVFRDGARLFSHNMLLSK
jgi:hypothetical protein